MPLPQQVVDQLGKEPDQTQGWAFGLIFFSGAILFLMIAIYLGMVFGYEPYIQKQITQNQNQVSVLNQSISATDQANLIHFYSQISNLQSLLQQHVFPSQFFDWLEKNTEANVYYQSFSLTSGYKVNTVGYAANESEVNQQIAIFENSPEIRSVSISSVAVAPVTGGWNFTVILTMNPSLFAQPNQ